MSALARALTTIIAATVAPIFFLDSGFVDSGPFISIVACILHPSSRIAFAWLQKSLSPGVEHERGEQQGQIDHAHLEQIACVHLRLDGRAGAGNARESNRVTEIDDAKQ